MASGTLAAPALASNQDVEKRSDGTFLTCVADALDYPTCVANIYCKPGPYGDDGAGVKVFRFPWSENLLGDKCSHCQCL